MKKNKLYTVNEYNRDALIDGYLFDNGGPTLSSISNTTNYLGQNANFLNTNLQSPTAIPHIDWSNGAQRAMALGQMNAAINSFGSDNPVNIQQSNKMLSNNLSGGGNSEGEGFGKSAMGAVAAIPETSFKLGNTEYKRGLWDLADPLYQLAGNKENVVGNTFSDAGVAMTKAGLQSGNGWVALAGGITKGIGSLINAAWGIGTDKDLKAGVDAGILANNRYNSYASNFDEIVGPEAVVDNANVYTGGWFVKDKAARKNRELQGEINLAKHHALGNLENNMTNIMKNQMDMALNNYAAFGGPLDTLAYGDSNLGAIGYDFMRNYLDLKNKAIDNKAYATGGPLHTHGGIWSNGVTFIDNGGTHEANPYEGVPMGIAPDGKPNLVEEGEVIFNDYVFSNRIEVPNVIKRKYKLGGMLDMTFADAAKIVQKESEERPNDPISQRGLEDMMYKLMMEQEALREDEKQLSFAKGGKIHIAPSKKGTFTAAAKKHGKSVQSFASQVLNNPENYSPAMRKKANFAKNAAKWKHGCGGHLHANGDWLTNLRYVPALTSGLNVFTDVLGLTNTSDYEHPDRLMSTTNTALSEIPAVHFKPIGNYLKYEPLDRLFYSNQLQANVNAGMRNIMNLSGQNRGAALSGIVATNKNLLDSLGNFYRKGDEYDFDKKLKVAEYNKGTDMFNSEGFLKAATVNAQTGQRKASLLIDAAERAAMMRNAIDTAASAGRSTNLTTFSDNLGNIGREETFKRWIKDNPTLLWYLTNNGMFYKGSTSSAKGGYLTIKNKRRR